MERLESTSLDSIDEIIRKVKLLAAFIKQAKYICAYTGAGISTSANIPDYTGPNGIWTKKRDLSTLRERFESAQPTVTHNALVTLEKLGYLKFIISTTIDGLHLRSGFPSVKLAEMHGNAYLRRCEKCRMKQKSKCSIGARNEDIQCSCGGILQDSVVPFGHDLPEVEFALAGEHSWKSDFALVLGTSMRVAPANKLPCYSYKKNNGKMVIVNLEETPFDSDATLKISATTDRVMSLLMEELEKNNDKNSVFHNL